MMPYIYPGDAVRNMDKLDRLRAKITELEAEVERLRPDAERYRAAWDESIDTIEIKVWVGSEDNGGWEYPRSKDECDRAIDATLEVE